MGKIAYCAVLIAACSGLGCGLRSPAAFAEDFAREHFSLCVDGHPRKRLPNCPPSVVDPGVCISYGGLEPRPGYERDHIVPLCAGGPDTPDNMQYQPLAEARKKDVLERRMCEELCRGKP